MLSKIRHSAFLSKVLKKSVLLAALIAAPSALLAVPVANNDSFTVAEDASLVISNGGVVFTTSFGGSSSVLGTTWQYLDRIQNPNGTDQSYPVDASSRAWNSSAFDTASSTIGPWNTGTAPLQGGVIDGFPPGTPNTLAGIGTAGNGQNLVTTYLFRQNFTLTAAQATESIWQIEHLFDDGGVVYINGVEVFRTASMPQGAITTNTLSANGDETTPATAQINLSGRLVTGLNTIAVEVHQTTLTSSDVGFQLNLLPNAASSSAGFVYADDTFNGTVQPNFATGSVDPTGGFQGPGLFVQVGGRPFILTATSGGWSKQFTLDSAATATVSFRYRLTFSDGYESDEFGQAIFELNGIRYGSDVANSLRQFSGDGNGGGGENDSGWQLATFNIPLTAGSHTMVLGAYSSKSTAADEITSTWFDDVTVSIPQTGSGVLLNDTGNNPTAILVTSPTHGTLNFNSDGSFTYQPSLNYNGPDSFTYRARDASGDSNPATVNITVTPVNDAPLAVADSYLGNENQTLSQAAPGVLANDSDLENNPLTAVLVSTVTRGTLQLNANGSFTYTPNAGFFGTDTFTYRANDGIANSATATVTLTVTPINDPPVAVNDNYTTVENVPISITASSGLAQVVFSSDFNGASVPSQITGPGTLVDVAGYAGRGPAGNLFGGKFLRNAAPGNPAPATTLTLTNLPPHQSLSLKFLLAVIDSWDGNNDNFIIRVDGVTVFNYNFQNNGNNQTFPYPTGSLIFRDEEVGFSNDANTFRDAAYNMARVPALRDIPHTASTATITIFASGSSWAGGPDESWAIDNLEVSVSATPVETLVSAGATWSYLDNGSDQGAAWRTPGFNASTWLSGPAQLGYGDGDEATIVGFGGDSGNKFITTYFRHSFTVADVGQFGDLIVGFIRDDGGAIYLNGTRIVLDNLDPGATYTSPANLNTDLTYENTWSEFSVPAGLLVEGTNVIAVEMHQADPTSSDISMDAYLLGKRSLNAGVLSNDIDPENDALTAEQLTSPQHGTLELNADGTFLYTPNVNYEGQDSFTYRANDGEFNSNPATVTLTMTSGPNNFPVTLPDTYSTNEDTTLTVNDLNGVLKNDSDSDSPTLAAILNSQPVNGTVSLNPGGGFSYTPNLNFSGIDTFTYRATDATNITQPVTVTINVNPVNDAPTSLPDLYLTSPGQTLVVSAANGILSNDTDPDNPTLTAVLQATTTSGTLNLSSNGSFTYAPAGGFSGTVTFTYRASDGTSTSAITTVTIQVNTPPVANNDTYLTNEDTPLIKNAAAGLLVNDVDSSPLTTLLISNPTNGTLTLSLDGSFIYIPNGDFHGTDTFTYRASDAIEQSGLATVTITVTPVNDSPRTKDDFYETGISQNLVIPANLGVLSNDVDIDSPGMTAVLTNNVTSGSLTFQPDGSFTYSPVPDFAGTVTFTYKANDGSIDSGETTVTIVVLPEALNIVINEIMYNPPSGNDLDEFIELTNIGTTDISLAGWQFSSGVNFTFPAVTIPAGGFLVIAADTATFQTTYGALPNVIGNWVGKLSNSGERIRLLDQSGAEVDDVHYYDQGDWATRARVTVANALGWAWTSNADALGSSLELINPALSNKQGQNWAASLNNLPTPSAPNSTASDNTAPLILGVEHFPAIPTPSDPIGIVAELRDEAGESIGGTLHYRVSAQNPGPFLAATMLDDGYNCDSEAGDGIYGHMLPPMANGTIIEFYISATDGTNARTWPAPASNGQTANALLQVSNEANNFGYGFYRIITPVSEYAQWQAIQRSSDAMMNATLILDDGSGPKIRYLAGMRVRGAGSRSHTPPPMRITIPRDREWNNASTMNLNTKFTYLQFLGMKLFQASEMQAPDTFRVQVRINGTSIARNDSFDYGSMVHVQPLSGDYIDDKFPNDNGGNLYKKVRPDVEMAWRNGNIGAYEADGWIKQTNGNTNDWSDLDELLRVINTTSTDPDYLAQVEAVADVDQWLKWFAAMTILANGETNISNGADDDYSLYRGVVDPRFALVPHDLDTILGLGDSSRITNPNHTLFDVIESSDVLDPFVPFFTHPQIIDRYYRALRELLQTTFSKPEFDELLNTNLQGWIPNNTLTGITTFMDARRAFIETQITPVIGAPNALPLATSVSSVDSPHGPLYISEILAINNNTQSVDGARPDAIELHNSGPVTINLSGLSLTDDPALPNRFTFPPGTSIGSGEFLVIWSGPAQATPGLYTGFNLDGQGEILSLFDSPANGGTLLDSVTFGLQIPDYSIGRVGPNTATWELGQPSLGSANQRITLGDPTKLRINEWLSQPARIFDREFVELYNPEAFPVALGSIAISDDTTNFPNKHLLPNLSFVAPGGFTVLFPAGNSANPTSADQLPFHLNSENEWVAIRGSNGVLIDQIHFVNQIADLSRGRVPDGGGNYQNFPVPTPGYSNSIQLVNEELLLQSLRISEIMYDPLNGSDLEFIELQNIGSEPINLKGVRFTEGINFDFPDMVLLPGKFVLVVNNITAFNAFYGPGLNIAGQYSGKLDNGGERIRLEISSINAGILDFKYDDWYPAADGAGFSLNFNDTSLPASTWGDKQNWAASLTINGTPGKGGFFSINLPNTLVHSLTDNLVITPVISAGPFSPAAISYQWQFVNGPAPVAFATPTQSSTGVAFSQAGIYTLQLNATAFGVNEANSVTVTVYDAYQAWVNRNFGGSTPGVTDKSNDPDDDGIDNLSEFAFSTDPQAADSNLFPLPYFDRIENALTVTYSKNFFDPTHFSVVVEVSSDLKNWTSSPAAVTSQILSNTFGIQTIRALDRTTAPATRARFMRLRVVDLSVIPASDSLRILGITNAPEVPTISFTSVIGKRYQLESTINPQGTWTTIGTPLTASTPVSVLTDTTSPTDRLRLYRIVQLP